MKVSLLILITSFIGYLLLHFKEVEREELLLPVSPSIEEEVDRSERGRHQGEPWNSDL